MKKTYLLILVTLFISSISVIGQNLVVNGDLESWDDPYTPSNWDHVESISQESTIVHDGTYSARQQSADGTQDFGHEYITGIIAGGTYQLSYYFFDNDVNARTRIWSKWLDDSGSTIGATIESEYSEDSPDWQLYDEEFIAPIGTTQFYLEVRVYKGDNPGGYVYYDDFSFINDQTIYPEPTNYPTAFIATTNGLSINLSWDESSGDQLPTGYLILGEKTASPSFVPPVDGVPVVNDLDWSDDNVAINVSYGSGEYLFTALATNGTYSFTVYPFTNTGSDIDYKTDGSAPVSTATTANLSVINYEPFNISLGAWSQYSVTGDQVWEWADFGDPPGCAKGNGYDGGPVENEDWLISPELNLAGYINITFGFDHARNYASNEGLFVMVSTDYQGSGDPNAATWSDITTSFSFPDPGSWTFTDAGTSDITSYQSDATYLAFVYNSTSSDASTWEIDNVEVFGVASTGISNNSVIKLNVYPNPASNKIHIKANERGVVRILNVTGQLLIDSEIVEGKNSINIETLNSGLYIVETVSINGLKSIGKFMVR